MGTDGYETTKNVGTKKPKIHGYEKVWLRNDQLPLGFAPNKVWREPVWERNVPSPDDVQTVDDELFDQK